ncbi:MAG: hypothetical protein H0T72_04140 [Chloroflexia bacterium]|nr:hypothetical protein [Chloroflexia bacterium]
MLTSTPRAGGDSGWSWRVSTWFLSIPDTGDGARPALGCGALLAGLDPKLAYGHVVARLDTIVAHGAMRPHRENCGYRPVTGLRDCVAQRSAQQIT